MDEIPLPPGGISARLEALGIRRRDAFAGAAAVAGIVVVALMLLWRDAPAVIAPPATSTPDRPAVVGASPSPMTGVYVHVAGSVRAPGLYGLPVGARVADAIAAAGGARANADLDAINLAQVVTDGLKVDVPRAGADVATSTDAPSPGSGPGAMVSLNSADQAALEVIPGIGPVKAAAIVQYRTDNGAFSSLDELLEVSGIGPATLESIRPYVAL